MKLKRYIICILASVALGASAGKPWDHGRLTVLESSPRFLSHEDSTAFFYMGDTAWLLPERTDRDEAARYLRHAAEEGFNVVQVQVINGVPAVNRYGALSNPDGWNMQAASVPGVYGYWEHMDHIVDTAERNGIYVGMVCIWGGLVKAGLLSEADATGYGEFLARRYRDRPNIIWIIGGDIPGDTKTEVWDALARAIRANDKNHLMTFHPRGRHTSAQWFADRDWLDFHMYQSGHRRNGQRRGDPVYSIPDGTEEHCWQFADTTFRRDPRRPVIDGEPSYEQIPKGLHDAWEPVWNAREVRRYAYWDVFAGCAGHTYGHNAVMQFARPGLEGAYHLDTDAHPWWRAQKDEGYRSMKHLRALMERLPFRTGKPLAVPGHDAFENRIAATSGDGYTLYYNWYALPMSVPAGEPGTRAWWMDAATGDLTYIGETPSARRGKRSGNLDFTPAEDRDGVLILLAPGKEYLSPTDKNITDL